MRQKLWMIDTVFVDLEDRDVTVKLVHARNLSSITIEFRMAEAALETSVLELRQRAEFLARDRVLDLASWLEQP